MKRKAKFRVGDRVWCCICGIPVTVLAIQRPYTGRARLSCQTKGFPVDLDTEVRPLTRREKEGKRG